jgi:hypothetical protein
MQKDNDNGCNRVTIGTESTTIPKYIGGRSRVLDVMCQSMKRVGRVTIASRPTTNVSNGELGGRKVRAKEHRWKLRETGATNNAETNELEKTRVMKMTTMTMHEIAT